VYLPDRGYTPLPDRADEIHLSTLPPQRLVWQNAEAALWDVGDRVALFEFRSKGNTLGMQVLAGLSTALDLVGEGDWRGLVIGNGSEHFSGGANLAEMGAMAREQQWDAFANLIQQFQHLMQRINYFHKPIVAAVRGRALGGGCELVLACPHGVAAAESYIGLVEVGVGLIPGGCGLMRTVALTAERAASEAPQDIQPFLVKAFETIATAKVSTSAAEAQSWGYLPATARIVMNSDRCLYVAREEVIRLDQEGYIPPPKRNAIRVLGRSARAALQLAAYTFQQAGYASEYDRYLADRLAYVMTGGDLSAPSWVDEDYLLQLERENFVPLLSQPKTQERIAHLLSTKKPLRN
jgi:3-hydroxyacyl-CoA dehydrogenase